MKPGAAMVRAAALLALVAVPLAACGKKGPPDPPDQALNTYPRTYPPDNADPRDPKSGVPRAGSHTAIAVRHNSRKDSSQGQDTDQDVPPPQPSSSSSTSTSTPAQPDQAQPQPQPDQP
jgi:predicted small lipoprotein YifL